MRKLNQITLIVILTSFSFLLFGQNTSKSEILLDLKNLETIKSLLNKGEPSFLTKYGTVLVAVVALLGTIITSIITNRRSRINTEKQISASSLSSSLQLKANSESLEKQLQVSKDNLTNQLNASEKHLISQIEANKQQDIEKRDKEFQFKLKNELKETVAKFINIATTLNSKLIPILLEDIEYGRPDEADEEYSKTKVLRDELTNFYYSIKVTLDGSPKQKELENIIDEYMNFTCFKVNLSKLKIDDFEQPIGKLFHKIKSIIHENYQEPI